MGTYLNYETLIRWYYLDWLANSLKSFWRMFNNIFFSRRAWSEPLFFVKASVIRFQRKMIPNSSLLLCKNIFVLNPWIWSCKTFQFASFHFRLYVFSKFDFSQTKKKRFEEKDSFQMITSQKLETVAKKVTYHISW